MDFIGNLLGKWSQELNVFSILLRIFLSVILSAIIGCERASKRHSAGLRTFILVSLTTTATMILDMYLVQFFKEGFFVLSASAITGLAIISIRSLFVSAKSQIKGFTTAVGLWASGVVGLLSGAGLYTVTLIIFIILMGCLAILPIAERYLKNRSNHFEIHLELKDSSYLKNFVSTIRRLGLSIDEIEANLAYAKSGLSVYSIAISISNEELKKYKTHKEIIEALRSLDYIYYVEEMWL